MLKKFLLVLSVAILSGSCSRKGNGNSLELAYRQLVEALGDQEISMWNRETARSMLSRGDKEVIPILIESLRDTRVFDPEYKTPSASANTKPRVRTVGETCEAILYQVISGGQSTQYRVENWDAWWQQNKGRKLHEIIRMVQSEAAPEK